MVSPISHILKPEAVETALTAGNAILTFVSTETGEYFTYQVTKAEDKELWFVKVLTSGDNQAGYTYMGSMFYLLDKLTFRTTGKSKISDDALSVKVFDWVLRKLENPSVLAKMEISHAGYCLRCGKLLTTPESIESGFGPYCRSKVK